VNGLKNRPYSNCANAPREPRRFPICAFKHEMNRRPLDGKGGREMSRGLAGYTIVEVLIVVVILAILAMVVAPHISSATKQTRDSAASTDVQTLQKLIELYKLQHDGRGPHLDDKGKQQTSQFVSRMTKRTDRDGKIDKDGECGPYLDEWPANPFVKPSKARTIEFGTDPTPPMDGKAGWYYNTDTCQIFLNSPMEPA